MANQYIDAEEVDQWHRDDITRVPPSDHPAHRNDDHDHRYDDCDHRYDSRDYRDGQESLKAEQFHCRRPDNVITSVEQPRAKHSYDVAYQKLESSSLVLVN